MDGDNYSSDDEDLDVDCSVIDPDYEPEFQKSFQIMLCNIMWKVLVLVTAAT